MKAARGDARDLFGIRPTEPTAPALAPSGATTASASGAEAQFDALELDTEVHHTSLELPYAAVCLGISLQAVLRSVC